MKALPSTAGLMRSSLLDGLSIGKGEATCLISEQINSCVIQSAPFYIFLRIYTHKI